MENVKQERIAQVEMGKGRRKNGNYYVTIWKYSGNHDIADAAHLYTGKSKKRAREEFYKGVRVAEMLTGRKGQEKDTEYSLIQNF